MKKALRMGTGALIAAAAITTTVATAPAAFADSHGCGGNVCVTFTGGGGGDVGVSSWAYGETVTGYFTITGPGNYSSSSDSETWTGGDDSDAWNTTVPSATSGTYCVTLTGSNGQSFGTACESVS